MTTQITSSSSTHTTTLSTGAQVRLAARTNSVTLTSGLAPTYLQANLIVLPSRYADDFRLLCARNPVPCPLLAESNSIGSFTSLQSHIKGVSGDRLADSSLDLRRDAPLYMVYQNGELQKKHVGDIMEEWSNDHVGFLIGCSYSFEAALSAAGLPPRHTVMNRNVPMYRTTIPLCPAGVFMGSTFVVSMRPYRKKDVERVRDITRAFVSMHGEPIAWGWEAVDHLGIENIDKPEWGEAPLTEDGKRSLSEDRDDDEFVPVFWGCGVTPQEAVMKANLEGCVMGHAPGHMVVLDVREDEVFKLPGVEVAV